MRNLAGSVALLVVLLTTAGAAPVPRDDTPAALIGRWEWAGMPDPDDRSHLLGGVPSGYEETLEFRPNNTLEIRRVWSALPGTSRVAPKTLLTHGTYGVRRGVISEGWRDGSAHTRTILELTDDKLLVDIGNGCICWWRRLPPRPGTPARK